MKIWIHCALIAALTYSCADKPNSSVDATATSRSGESIDTESGATWELSRDCDEIISKLVELQQQADMSTVMWESEDVFCLIDLLSQWSTALNLAGSETGQFDGLLPLDGNNDRIPFKKIAQLARLMSEDMLTYRIEQEDSETDDPDEYIAHYQHNQIRWHLSPYPLDYEEATRYCEALNDRQHRGSQSWMNADFTLVLQNFSDLISADSSEWSGVDVLRARSRFTFRNGGSWNYGIRSSSSSSSLSSYEYTESTSTTFALCVRRLAR